MEPGDLLRRHPAQGDHTDDFSQAAASRAAGGGPGPASHAYAAATLAGQLAELVNTMRTRAGLTQTELARRTGTTQSSIARIEGGGSLPTLDMPARLAHATGTPLRLAAPGITDVDLGGAA
jgi:DNA-binding XRE family transcriptional regulator